MAANGESWINGGSSKGAVDVHEVLGSGATKGLFDMIEAGALVSLGTTSDGGALGITVTIDGEWRREYVRTLEEVELYLAEAVPAVVELAGGPRPSAAPRQRARRSKTR